MRPITTGMGVKEWAGSHILKHPRAKEANRLHAMVILNTHKPPTQLPNSPFVLHSRLLLPFNTICAGTKKSVQTELNFYFEGLTM